MLTYSSRLKHPKLLHTVYWGVQELMYCTVQWIRYAKRCIIKSALRCSRTLLCTIFRRVCCIPLTSNKSAAHCTVHIIHLMLYNKPAISVPIQKIDLALAKI